MLRAVSVARDATHVLGEQTGIYETKLYQTTVKSQGFIYRASFQYRLH